ncbi:MAG: hypothetical protein ACK5U4_11730 [Rhodospirillales bacterium]|jgi:hypothetical protein
MIFSSTNRPYFLRPPPPSGGLYTSQWGVGTGSAKKNIAANINTNITPARTMVAGVNIFSGCLADIDTVNLPRSQSPSYPRLKAALPLVAILEDVEIIVRKRKASLQISLRVFQKIKLFENF